jgi:Arylsulfotransferase (ASST)
VRIISRTFLLALVSCVGISATIKPAFAYESTRGPTGVLHYDRDNAYDGYTLLAPNLSRMVYLIDMKGRMVHSWETDYASNFTELLPNGNLLRSGKYPNPPIRFGGVGGIVQEIDWNGNVVWEYINSDTESVAHHTALRLPNGNTIVQIWEYYSRDEAIAKGRDPATLPTTGPFVGLWPDALLEVEPDGTVVWEWRVWDHIGEDANQININSPFPVAGGPRGTADLNHGNSLDYLPDEGIIVWNAPSYGEFYYIDHQSGEILFRWGNPCAYGAGECPSFMDDGDQVLWGQHGTTVIDEGLPGAGNILIFNNGYKRPSRNFSEILEVNVDPGLTGAEVVWDYKTLSYQSLFAEFQGFAQRLPNGNTVITSAGEGHVIEVTAAGDIAWEFVSPIMALDADTTEFSCMYTEEHVRSTPPGGLSYNTMFRTYRYAPDYPGLAGKKLNKKRHFNSKCPVGPGVKRNR